MDPMECVLWWNLLTNPLFLACAALVAKRLARPVHISMNKNQLHDNVLAEHFLFCPNLNCPLAHSCVPTALPEASINYPVGAGWHLWRFSCPFRTSQEDDVKGILENLRRVATWNGSPVVFSKRRMRGHEFVEKELKFAFARCYYQGKTKDGKVELRFVRGPNWTFVMARLVPARPDVPTVTFLSPFQILESSCAPVAPPCNAPLSFCCVCNAAADVYQLHHQRYFCLPHLLSTYRIGPNSPTNSIWIPQPRPRLTSWATELGSTIHPVPGDGNCFYHGLALVVGDQGDHQALRRQLVEFMSQQELPPAALATLLHDATGNVYQSGSNLRRAYLDYHQRDGAFADELVYHYAAILFQVNRHFPYPESIPGFTPSQTRGATSSPYLTRSTSGP